jgi:hypothetical protein
MQRLQQLINHVLFVDFFQNTGSNDGMQVRFCGDASNSRQFHHQWRAAHHSFLTHMIKHKVNVPIILRPNDVHQANDVVVARKLLQVHDFTIRPLGVRGIAKRVEALFQRHSGMSALVCSLPHDAIRLPNDTKTLADGTV